MTRAGAGTAGDPLAELRRIAGSRSPAPGERCEMCAAPVSGEHSHVVDVGSRALLCACRPCWLLFTAEDAQLRYRAVPDRYLSFPGLRLDPALWDELQIPVGLAFFFHNSALGRTVAFYPGAAGAAESELPLSAWAAVVAAEPALGTLRPDVEALVVRVPADCYLVPVDACYELVGLLRRAWRGFDGGAEARALVDGFFARAAARARPAPGARA